MTHHLLFGAVCSSLTIGAHASACKHEGKADRIPKAFDIQEKLDRHDAKATVAKETLGPRASEVAASASRPRAGATRLKANTSE